MIGLILLHGGIVSLVATCHRIKIGDLAIIGFSLGDVVPFLHIRRVLHYWKPLGRVRVMFSHGHAVVLAWTILLDHHLMSPLHVEALINAHD